MTYTIWDEGGMIAYGATRAQAIVAMRESHPELNLYSCVSILDEADGLISLPIETHGHYFTIESEN